MAEKRVPIRVEYKGKRIDLEWSSRTFIAGNITFTSRIYYKPGTKEEWFYYDSEDTVEKLGADGKNLIRHHAWILLVKKKFIRGAETEFLEDYDGYSIDDSTEKFCEILEKVLDVTFSGVEF